MGQLKEFSASLDENRIEYERESLKSMINEFESEYQNKLIDWSFLKRQSFIPFDNQSQTETKLDNKLSYQSQNADPTPELLDPNIKSLMEHLLRQILGEDSEITKDNITKAKFNIIGLKTKIYL